MQSTDRSHRIFSLDLLRSLAIISMVVYHFLWDLEAFGIVSTLSKTGNIGRAWEIVTAGTFLALVGVSFALSYERRRAHGRAVIIWRSCIRGGVVLGCAALVSIGTYAMDPKTWVRFGVLHLIGISILLLPYFAPLKRWNILIGLLMMLIPSVPSTPSLPPILAIPLGFPPPWFVSVDYFPVFPWMGLVLFGLGCSQWIIAIARAFDRTLTPYYSSLLPVLWPGRNALLIYMLHQPLLIGAIMLAI